MVRVGAARSFMITTSDQLDIYRARSAGAPDDAGARCRARPSVETLSAGRRAATAPHVTSAARGTVDALARRANARRPDLRVAPDSGEAMPPLGAVSHRARPASGSWAFAKALLVL